MKRGYVRGYQLRHALSGAQAGVTRPKRFGERAHLGRVLERLARLERDDHLGDLLLHVLELLDRDRLGQQRDEAEDVLRLGRVRVTTWWVMWAAALVSV